VLLARRIAGGTDCLMRSSVASTVFLRVERPGLLEADRVLLRRRWWRASHVAAVTPRPVHGVLRRASCSVLYIAPGVVRFVSVQRS
jgi:hypothetical protein